MFAKVIVDIKHEEVNQFYDYIIPDQMSAFLLRGMRVIVPFGPQKRLGFVTEIMHESQDATKEILEILDVVPTIDEELFLMVDMLLKDAPNLMTSVYQSIIPNELLVSYQKEVHVSHKEFMPAHLLSFVNKQGVWQLKKKDVIYSNELNSLRKKGIIEIRTVIKQKMQEKTENAYRLNSNHQYPRISKYPLINELFQKKPMYTRKELIDLIGSLSILNTLEKNEVIIREKAVTTREILHHFEIKDKVVNFTETQSQVYQSIQKMLNTSQSILLKGITGSGKTEIYLKLIDDVITQGKKVLYLVPEITLVAPTAQRLKSRFDDVAIYHSGLSKGERYDQYQQVLSQQAKIILGTRSACFLPIDQLGLIIMDESHDIAYEQTEGVIYETKDILKLRSQYHQAPLVLGSATPSVEDMYEAINGQIALLELNERPLELKLPKLHYVDMKKELQEKNLSIFSRLLLEKMKDRLEKKEQIMLLFNRKGYAPFVLCRHCGDVPKCPSCDVSLVYYKDQETLKCHYCGFEKPFSPTCEVCNEQKVKEIGVGIEYVEHALKKELPEARILRMDQNTTKTKQSHEILWQAFKNEDADVLIGTQMIAKGLDFPKVTLVGVLMADLLLKVPSYRSSEQTYNLLSQITGRSGRFLPGEAIIQAYDLSHYAIQSVSKNYEAFYKQAIHDRKLLQYLPFKHTSQILIEGLNFLKTYQQAFLIKKALSQRNIQTLGPSQPMIKRIKNLHRFTLTIKYETIDYKQLFELIENFKTEAFHIKYYKRLDLI